jgi:FHS family L-fucose permease-like MFS transporter
VFVLASGTRVLPVGAHPYLRLVGDPGGAPSRLNLAQALNSLGTTVFPWVIGPLILSAAVLGADQLAAMPIAEQAAYRATQAQSVQVPYLLLAGGLLALAVFVLAMRIPALREATERADHARHGFGEVLQHRHLRWGVVAIFVYVGAEVSIGSFLIYYISGTGIGGLTEAAASRYLAFYWGGAMVGRFVGAALLRTVDARGLLALFAGIASALLLTTMLTGGHVAMWSVIAIGLFNSIMFPTIFTIAIERLGPLTSKASSLLVMAIVGGAVVPWLQGKLADEVGIQSAFVIPLACYAFIAWYGLRGSRLGDTLPPVTTERVAGPAH